MPEAWFLAEYMGVFGDTEDSVFQYEHVMNSLSGDVQPLFAPVAEPQNGLAHIDFSTLLVR